MQLHIEMQGTGFPILCLHGHPGSGRAMSVFTDHLSQRFWTIAPDLRGYGKSQAKGKFTMADHLQDLQDLLEELQIQRCLLLGWSLGGILALELALRFQERFSGLILVASAARPRSSHPRATWQDLLYTGIAGSLNGLYPGWEWNIKTFGQRSLFRYLFGTHSREAYRYLAAHGVPAYLNTSQGAQKALTEALKQGYDRTPDLAHLHLPCLLLAGENDRHITAQSSRETAQTIPYSQWHCYPKVAHLFPWEIPTQVQTTIDHWLIDHSALGVTSNLRAES
ncbi:alpha/beta hydrolase [Spirulina sp. CS-785/01]|uniref:alpha/beta fold hydrolase n=1 Tax=Spirulina sp. CS-785/01 TaxID=3021716 RepID=UPI00232FA323|nr:alpha/beta hydrolase [Spirulina sp. CS-785/01]MDB9313437.1 alpha/beta hydrolase [Spirulina sp. CS-785/01]